MRVVFACAAPSLLILGVLLLAGEALAGDKLVSKDDFLRQLGGEEVKPAAQPEAAPLRLRGPAGVRPLGTVAEEPASGTTTSAPSPSPGTPAPLQAVQAPASAQASAPAPAQGKPAPVKEITVAINFKSGGTQLADEFSRRQVQQIAEAFASPALKAARIEVGGHTDGVGSADYNRALSLRRAKAVRDDICRKNKASCARFTVVGYGLSQPVASNDDEEGRARNRRVVFKRLD